jgi:hypothetical protein
MYRGARNIRKPFAMALTFGVSFALVGCGEDSTPAVTPTAPVAQAKPAPAKQKPLSKAELKKKLLEDEPTALEKRAARLKAAKGNQ